MKARDDTHAAAVPQAGHQCQTYAQPASAANAFGSADTPSNMPRCHERRLNDA
jgi:hypothetical protein